MTTAQLRVGAKIVVQKIENLKIMTPCAMSVKSVNS